RHQLTVTKSVHGAVVTHRESDIAVQSQQLGAQLKAGSSLVNQCHGVVRTAAVSDDDAVRWSCLTAHRFETAHDMPFGIESDDHQTDSHGERHPLSRPKSLSVVMNPRGQTDDRPCPAEGRCGEKSSGFRTRGAALAWFTAR